MAEYIAKELNYKELIKKVEKLASIPNEAKTIVDAEELPTENIDTNVFYRVSQFGGYTLFNGEKNIIDGVPTSVIIVDTLPEVGDYVMVFDESGNPTCFTMYYQTSDNIAYAYWSAELSGLEADAWVTAAESLGVVVVSSDAEATDESIVYIVMSEISEIYYYGNGWEKFADNESVVKNATAISENATAISENATAISENATAISTEVERAKAEEKRIIDEEIVNPDYAENDTSKKSHILNRPFYEETVLSTYSTTSKDISVYKSSEGTYVRRIGLATTRLLYEEDFPYCRVKFSRKNYASTGTGTITSELFSNLSPTSITDGDTLVAVHFSSDIASYICEGYIVYDASLFNQLTGIEVTSSGIYLGYTYYNNNGGRVYTMTAFEYDEPVIHKLDNQYLDLANNEDFQQKQDKLVNTTSFETVPVITRNSDEIQYVTVSDGGQGSSVIVRRAKDANINLPPEAKIPDAGDIAASVNKVNTLIGTGIAGITQGTIYGNNIASGESITGAIRLDDYGLFVVKGDNVTVSYIANDATQCFEGDVHFIIKYIQVGGANKIIHIYQKAGSSILTTTVSSFDGTLSSALDVLNGSTEYGARVVKMNMKSVTTD